MKIKHSLISNNARFVNFTTFDIGMKSWYHQDVISVCIECIRGLDHLSEASGDVKIHTNSSGKDSIIGVIPWQDDKLLST